MHRPLRSCQSLQQQVSPPLSQTSAQWPGTLSAPQSALQIGTLVFHTVNQMYKVRGHFIFRSGKRA